jgi:uncharacterized protein
MSKPFLTAAWKNLVLINYSVDPAILKPYLPYGVELDSFNGIHYLSLYPKRLVSPDAIG